MRHALAVVLVISVVARPLPLSPSWLLSVTIDTTPWESTETILTPATSPSLKTSVSSSVVLKSSSPGGVAASAAGGAMSIAYRETPVPARDCDSTSLSP